LPAFLDCLLFWGANSAQWSEWLGTGWTGAATGNATSNVAAAAMPRTSFLIGIVLVAPPANGQSVIAALAPQMFLSQSEPNYMFGY
jgi:hypothetical protein